MMNSKGDKVVLNEYIIPKLRKPFQSGSGLDF